MMYCWRRSVLVGIAMILLMSSFAASQTTPAALAQSRAAQSPSSRSLSDQARRGRKRYAENCAMCHAEDLKGRDPAPALTGARFMRKWQGKTVWDLFDKIRKTMPQQDRGSLSPRTYLEVVAYIAKFNAFDVGDQELKNEPKLLKSMSIIRPGGKPGTLSGVASPSM